MFNIASALLAFGIAKGRMPALGVNPYRHRQPCLFWVMGAGYGVAAIVGVLGVIE
jgi:hypothetical protein